MGLHQIDKSVSSASILPDLVFVVGCLLRTVFLENRGNRTQFMMINVMDIKNGFVATVGNTPLIRLNSFSDETGCEVTKLAVKSSAKQNFSTPVAP
jgi:hypothetical protein